jgi:hypothetical protein
MHRAGNICNGVATISAQCCTGSSEQNRSNFIQSIKKQRETILNHKVRQDLKEEMQQEKLVTLRTQ